MRGTGLDRRRFLSLAAGTVLTGGLSARAKAAWPTTAVRVGGAGSALGGMQLLASAFSRYRPDIAAAVLPSLGSSGGIAALQANSIDLAVTTRDLSAEEAAAGLRAIRYARTPIVFASRIDNAVSSVDLADVSRILKGRSNHWPNGQRIRVVLRHAQDTVIHELRALDPIVDAAISNAFKREDVYIARNDQHNSSVLETVPGSFGATTLAQTLSEKRKLRLLSLAGVEGNIANLARGEYTLSKQLYWVTKAAPNAATRVFLDFMSSMHAGRILSGSGHLMDYLSVRGRTG